MRLRFYLDYISSNAYLAWLKMPELVRRHGLELEPIPVLFAGLLGAHGQLGPAEVPAKALWMWKNNLRKAALLRVPLNRPAYHPFNPLLSLRVSSLLMSADQRVALVDGLFQAVWVRELHVSELAIVSRIGTEVGLDGPQLVAAAQEDDAKSRLRAQTDDAIAAGVFGVPTMIVEDELFWGYDDLPYLERLLAGEDPLDHEAARQWMGPPRSSAVRKQARERGT